MILPAYLCNSSIFVNKEVARHIVETILFADCVPLSVRQAVMLTLDFSYIDNVAVEWREVACDVEPHHIVGREVARLQRLNPLEIKVTTRATNIPEINKNNFTLLDKY